ncbi:hypothetical protein MN116_001090 [Schistosoma mekongi]|uniref:C2H2-type domain-containing protein n=1 Tax=Schistosoma mekongi TaxID=38744 RepID=A0AAE2D949_SCHME|nr:hypothetical protein MN116_001090 [Schistosoma mekongi]
MPCVGIFSPIVMDTSSSSSPNQIKTCKSIDFCLPEINSPSPHALENSDHMVSGYRTNTKSNNNNNSDIHSSSKAQKFSPDLSQLTYPMVSTPQPPPLDLSNIPNSPRKSLTPDYLDVSSGMVQNSPRTTDSFQINTTTLTTTTITTTTNSIMNTNHDTTISDKSSVKCEVNSAPHDLNPIIPTMEKLVNVDWIEALKQYAESQTIIKRNTNSSNINNEIDLIRISEYNNNNNNNNNNNRLYNEPLNLNSHTTTGDFTSRFQAMLTNLSEFLFNSPQVANLAKNPTINNLNFLSPSSTTSANVLSSTFSISEMNSNKLKSDYRNQQPTNLSNSAYPNNFIDNQTGFNLFNGPDLSSTNPSLAITASLLGLLASGQKPASLTEQIVPQSSTYSKCSVTSPKSSYQSSGVCPQSFLGSVSAFPHQPPTSQVQPPRFLNPPVHSSFSPHSSLVPTSCALADPPNLNEPKLSDPRDLLYQLGQQLMAMATSGINGTRPSFDLWNTNNTDINYNQLGLASLNNPPNSAYIQPHITSSTDPITEQSRSPSLSSSPLVSYVSSSSSSSSFSTSGLENSFRHLPPLTQQHHSNTNTGPFSGISMRGNQKYSAYYQHQRKQGFQTGVINEYVNNTVGRRQRNSLSPLSTNTRYVGRRLRSGLNNTLIPVANLEMRNPQRFPAIRNQTALTGNTMNTGNNTNNNISGTTSSSSNLCSNVRGNTPYRMMPSIGNNTSSHLLNPTKSHLQTDNMSNTTHGQISFNNNNNNNNNNNSLQQAPRHRETAFICSCGKDFESLYIFTLHMKDTGHKPKCDQAEKDIPKLVRGQDMWINSETEQTREILRCMRCHQSFRSLPELTMHMMKTNHYSEIVYNDSGRCVYVNPDDNRRGSSSANSSTGASSHYSGNSNLSHTPGKSGPSSTSTSGGRRSHKNINTNWPNNTQANYSNLRLSSNEEMNSMVKHQVRPYMPTPDKYDIRKTEVFKRSGHLDDEQNLIKSDQLSTSEEYHKLVKNENNEEIIDKYQTDLRKNFNSLSSPTSSPLAISLSPSSTQCKNEEERQQSEKSLMNVDILDEVENKQDLEVTANESNVLQQTESFVEKNHPTTSVNNTGLSIKTELSDCNFIQSTPPESVINVVERNSPPVKLSPKSHRKRTYSEAGISIKSSYIPNTTSTSYSPASSPITMSGNELNSNNKFDSDATDVKQVIPVISNSPNTTAKVSSTSEMSINFSESPLSSLQKLVDTTHKPIKPTNVLNSISSIGFTGLNSTINSNMMSCNNTSNKFSRSVGLANATIVHSQYSPNKSGMNTCPGSPYSIHSTVSSSRLQASPLSSPLGENDNIIPALSALYAYVERSSSTSSSQLRDTQSNLKSELGSPNNSINKNNNSESGKNNLLFNDADKTDDIIPDVSSPPLLNHLSTPNTTTNTNNYSCNSNIVTSLLSQSSSRLPTQSQMLPPFPLPAHPLIQAIYAAAMSNLAGQCVNPQIPISSNGSTINDPLNAFKYAAMNFKEALDSFEVSSTGLQSKVLQAQSMVTTTSTTTSSTAATLSTIGSNGSDNQTMDFANNWLNMLRTLVESTEKFDGNNSGCNKLVNSYSESQNSSNTPDRLESHQLNNFGLHSSNSKSLPTPIHEQSISNSQQNIPSSAQNDPVHLNYPLSMNCNRSDYSYTPALPSSSSASLPSTISPLMNVPNMLQTSRLTNISSFHSVVNRSLSSNTTANNNINTSSNISSCINNTNSNNLMTTITKKAKCHFCGKPFANKGQVRLHISKNKCPCLLQQSCHVAALAAAFGSNTSNNTNTVTNNNNNPRKIPQSVGTLKPSAVNSYLSSTTCKRSNNNITSINITNANNGSSNINQNLTDSMLGFASNSVRSNSKDDLTTAPSALSLLKERFQNFDANQNPTTYSNFSSYLPTNKANLLESNLTISSSSSVTPFSSSYNSFPHSGKASTPSMSVSSSAPNMSWLSASNCTAFPNFQSNKDPEVMNASTPGTASSAAAVNAGHLAAMALLAQTLVQLTNATQSAPTSHSSLSQATDSVNNTNKTNITSQKSNPSENLFDSNNTFLPFLASNLLTSRNFLNLTPDQTIQSNMPFNFNLEALLNQMNMSKQLSSLNWPTNNQTMNMDDNQSSRQPQHYLRQIPILYLVTTTTTLLITDKVLALSISYMPNSTSPSPVLSFFSYLLTKSFIMPSILVLI